MGEILWANERSYPYWHCWSLHVPYYPLSPSPLLRLKLAQTRCPLKTPFRLKAPQTRITQKILAMTISRTISPPDPRRDLSHLRIQILPLPEIHLPRDPATPAWSRILLKRMTKRQILPQKKAPLLSSRRWSRIIRSHLPPSPRSEKMAHKRSHPLLRSTGVPLISAPEHGRNTPVTSWVPKVTSQSR